MIEYGYQMNNGIVTINHKESAVVKRVFKEYLEVQSAYAVAALLNQDKIPSLTGKQKWRSRTVSSILNKMIYCGDEIYPLIVEKHVFDEVNRILKDNPIRIKTEERLDFNKENKKYGLVFSENRESLMRLYVNGENELYWMVPRDIKYSAENSICGFIYDKDLTDMITDTMESLVSGKVRIAEDKLYVRNDCKRHKNEAEVREIRDWKQIASDFSEHYQKIELICTMQDIIAVSKSINPPQSLEKFILKGIHRIVVSKSGKVTVVLKNRQTFAYSYGNAKRW